MDKIDYLEKELTRLIDWIKSADTRIYLILPLSTAMLGAIAALIPEKHCWTIFSSISVSFAVSFLLASILSVALASFPRTKGPKGSMIFFEGISSRELEQFRKDVHGFSKDIYIDDLINQCHINSQIAKTKFYFVKKAILFLLIASIPWLLSIYTLYIS